MRAALFALVLCSVGCGGTVRFYDRQILWQDPDADPVPVPKLRTVNKNWLRIKAQVFSTVDGRLALQKHPEAHNVNALDEVPDSTWWQDKRRAAALKGKPFGPVQVAATEAPIDGSGTVTIIEGKEEGKSRRFVVTDTKGRKYLLKLDVPGYFGLVTSTEVVCSRLVGAAGWRVPSLSLVDLRRDQLVISPEAYIKRDGTKRAFTEKDLERFLTNLPLAPDGRYRFSASARVEGKLVGPYSYVGKRRDDLNDRVSHEDRRDLRGYAVMSAWINNVDTIESNTLDAYVGDPSKGHLIHYQQNVGGSFGNYDVGPLESWMSYESYFDLPRVVMSMLAIGAYSRPWARDNIEDERLRTLANWPELGWFESEHFVAKTWSPLWSNPAFSRATPRDLYWGVKRVLEFTSDELRAAIKVGRYRPEVEQRLFEVLWQRREKLARAYLSDVAPLESFTFVGDNVCFDDLMIHYGFDRREPEYEVRGAGPVRVDATAHRCFSIPRKIGYHIVAIRIRRVGGDWGPALRIHFMKEGQSHRIVGLER
ncbi:MAG: hypothetical protein ABI321_07910 [Polyangia bacterium]